MRSCVRATWDRRLYTTDQLVQYRTVSHIVLGCGVVYRLDDSIWTDESRRRTDLLMFSPTVVQVQYLQVQNIGYFIDSFKRDNIV